MKSFQQLGLTKGILDSCYLVIWLTPKTNKKMKSWTRPASWFPGVTPETKRQNIWSSFIYSFFCARLLDQKLGSSLIDFVYFRTTIWSKYTVLFYLFFLLCATTWPKIRVLIDLFGLFAHNHLTKMYGSLSFILSLCTTIRPKLGVSPTLWAILFLRP